MDHQTLRYASWALYIIALLAFVFSSRVRHAIMEPQNEEQAEGKVTNAVAHLIAMTIFFPMVGFLFWGMGIMFSVLGKFMAIPAQDIFSRF